jgi:hypothetical protein
MLRQNYLGQHLAKIIFLLFVLLIVIPDCPATSVNEVLTRMEQIEKKQTSDKEELSKQISALKNIPKTSEAPNLGPWLDSLSALKSKIEILSAQLASISIDTTEMPIERLSNLENAIADLAARLASNQNQGSPAMADLANSIPPTIEKESIPEPEKKEKTFNINGGADFVSRYVWRGMEFGSAPNIQPNLALTYKGFEFGFWGSYGMNNNEFASEESDIYLTYSYPLDSDIVMSFYATDYYYPNDGKGWGNFNDYNTASGGGAHMVEVGFSLSGPAGFPLGLSAYCNVFNDPGHNIYFQADYPFAFGETELNFFIGATGGSQKNPDYYGTDKFAIINMGIEIGKNVKLSETLSIPASISYSMNPRLEKSYIVLGLGF